MNKFKQCKICNEVHNYQSGEFTIHLQQKHQISREGYIVITEYNNEHPKCQCGLCNENARFIPRKNIFYKINSEHKNFIWLENKFIEKNGKPKCKTCEKNVKFHRGKPNIYCSYSCTPSNWNQETKNKTVMEKYGVDNVMKLDIVKNKVANKSKEFWKNNKEEGTRKIKQTKLERYENENYTNIDKIRNTCIEKFGVSSYSKTETFRDTASKTVIKTNEKNKFPTTKKYKRTNLYYQSSYEFSFLQYCEDKKLLNLVCRSKSFYYIEEDKKFGKRHLPDFVFLNKYIIETKSTYVLNTYSGGMDKSNAKKRSVEIEGFVYVLVLDKNLNEFNSIKERKINLTNK